MVSGLRVVGWIDRGSSGLLEPSGHLCEDHVWNGGEDVISLGMGGSYSPKAELYFRSAKPYSHRECREFEM